MRAVCRSAKETYLIWGYMVRLPGFKCDSDSSALSMCSSVFFFSTGKWWENWWNFRMYPLGTTTFSHQKIRFPTISHQFAEVVGKKNIFSSGKPTKSWRWWEAEKKNPSGKKKTLGLGPESLPYKFSGKEPLDDTRIFS